MLPHDEEFMKEYNKEVFEAGTRLINLNTNHLDKGIRCLETNIFKSKQEISQLNIRYDLDEYIESIKKKKKERKNSSWTKLLLKRIGSYSDSGH